MALPMLVCSAALQGEARPLRLPLPPPMPLRSIAPRGELPGETLEIEDGDRKYTLFLPEAMAKSSVVALTIHFHSAQWHAIQEHLDRGLKGPLIAFYPGEGSAIYQRSFEDKGRLRRWMDRVLAELLKRGFDQAVKIRYLDITSFSAGYGAVRELVKDPEAFKLMRRVVLADSMYGGIDPSSTVRRPDPEHILCWLPLAQAAIRREKTFVATYSQIVTPYASTFECGQALARAAGGEVKAVEKGTFAATLDSQFPLIERFDSGSFHLWGYGGTDGPAHMTHARHLADIWKMLDLAQEP